VPACPFVIDRREIDGAPGEGIAQNCTLCYDRAKDGLEPACANACPTESIQFGELDELFERAAERLEQVHADGFAGAQLYGADPGDGVRGFGAFFLLLTTPRSTACHPTRSRRHATCPRSGAGAVLAAAGTLAAVVGLAVAGDRS
jgi:formate dehydrogenase iron-sulfur subunit